MKLMGKAQWRLATETDGLKAFGGKIVHIFTCNGARYTSRAIGKYDPNDPSTGNESWRTVSEDARLAVAARELDDMRDLAPFMLHDDDLLEEYYFYFYRDRVWRVSIDEDTQLDELDAELEDAAWDNEEESPDFKSSFRALADAELLSSDQALSRKVSRAKALVGSTAAAVQPQYARQAIPKDVKIFVWQRDGGKCQECGDNRDLEFDHIIPVSMGGSNTARNLQLLCEPCNRSKGGNL